MKKSNKLSIFLFLVVFSFSSCDSSIEFLEFKSVENSIWKANDTISFSFSVKDTIQPKNVFIHIRNNNDYDFSNLYVITKLSFPNNQIVVDTLQYEIADKSGKLLGDGLASIKESKLFYKENKIFPLKGDYNFSIYHAMRKQGEIEPTSLEGVKEVGFSLEKIN